MRAFSCFFFPEDSVRGDSVGAEKGGICSLIFQVIKKADSANYLPSVLAEGEGFEPSIRNLRMPPFQGGTFNHSAILPGMSRAGSGNGEIGVYSIFAECVVLFDART